MPIDKLYIENIRSFHGAHEIPLKRITLLVGENSSGKTTILGTINAINEAGTVPYMINFNKEPYKFGRFEEIVTKRGGRAGQEKSFSIGIEYDNGHRGDRKNIILARYINIDGKSIFNNAFILSSKYAVKFKKEGIEKGRTNFVVCYYVINGGIIEKINFSNIEDKIDKLNIKKEFKLIYDETKNLIQRSGLRYERDYLPIFDLIYPRSTVFKSLNLAPIRSKPASTYESHLEKYSPEGDHIPYLIERACRSDIDSKLINSLKEFGKISRLFSNIVAVERGKLPGSLFEIQIKVNGTRRNLVYVGYGISQALPIIVDSLNAERGTTILMQQPEVHLHPRAQAALASALVQIAKSDDKRFIIETHSDYIIDRIRQEVAKGDIITNNDVNIIYTEMEGNCSKIYEITLNDHGDLQNVPPSYRNFFLDEEIKLLTR